MSNPVAAPTTPRNETMSWVALGLAVISVLMCGPFTSIPGVFIAMRQSSAAKAAGTPSTLASVALVANAIITVLSILGMAAMFLFFMLAMAAGV